MRGSILLQAVAIEIVPSSGEAGSDAVDSDPLQPGNASINAAAAAALWNFIGDRLGVLMAL